MYQLYYSLVIALLILSGSACSKKAPPPQGDKPIIVVSVSPYDTFVQEIVGDTVDVRVAVPANYNSHLFEPTPKHMQGFQHAIMWVGIGEPFEKKLLTTLESQNPHLVTVDLRQNIHTDVNDPDSITIGSCSHDHHDHEGEDLHFWMSPRMAAIQVEMITEVLIKTFPQHKHLYETNWAKLQKRLGTLNDELVTLLTPMKHHAIITSHPSLGYFCEEYHLIQIAIECEGKTVAPQDLQRILSLAKEHPICCVFTQEQFDNKGALAMAKQLHLPVYSINPNDPDYFNNLVKIAHHISKDKSS